MPEFPRRLNISANIVRSVFALLCVLATVSGVVAQKRGHVASIVVNLRDFGATGDGVTNDSPALQNSLDQLAANGGGTLEIPAGHYLLGTPVSVQFDPGITITLAGEPSATAIDVSGNGSGLDLTSEFIIAAGVENDALSLSGLDSLLINDVTFIGVNNNSGDARTVLRLNGISQATIRHCEFYGLATFTAGGAIVFASSTDLTIEQTAFLGCAADSGITTSIVQNINWLGISVSDSKFIDYGNRPDFFSKTPLQSPYSWVNIGSAANPQPNWPRREAVIRHVMLDEGGYFAISARPDLAGIPIQPFDVYLSRLRVNVTNLGSDGVLIVGARTVFIDQSHFGWSHNALYAIHLSGVDNAILDRIDCSDDATRFQVDAQRLAVINSNNTSLESTAPFTRVITTTSAEEDPAQFVPLQYQEHLQADPDPASHFYWTDRLLRCDADAACETQTKAALDTFLGASPPVRITLSGVISDQAGLPISGANVSLTGSASTSLTTDATGTFAFSNLPSAGAYTLSCSKAHYDFENAVLTTPVSNQVLNLTGTLQRHQISGRVFANTGRPLAGATLTLTGTEEQTATSDENGDYAFPGLAGGGDYLLTVERENYSFSNPTRSFSDLSADAYIAFDGALIEFTITGRLTSDGGVRLSGIRVFISGSQSDSVVTNSDGDYSFEVSAGDSCTVSPADSHWSFGPPSLHFDNIAANRVANFTGVRDSHSIGGRVFSNSGRALAGAVVTLSGNADEVAITDSSGDFLFSDLIAGGNYTISITRVNYTFSVTSYSFPDLISDQYVAFSGVLLNYTIAGKVRKEDGTYVSGAIMQLSGDGIRNATTDAGGNYSFTVPGDNNYFLAASYPNYSFTAPQQSFAKLSANQTADFVGELVDYTVSGAILTGEGFRVGGVTVSISGSQSGAVMTNHTDDFVIDLEAEGDYTIAPSKPNYTFSPTSISLNDLGGDHQLNFVATLNPGVPFVLTGTNPERALAFDAVLHTIEPFNFEYSYPWSSDRRTRVMLFAKNFDLAAGEVAANVTVTAEDADHHTHNLNVEWVGKVDGSDWLIGIIVRLNDDMQDLGDVMIRITHNGLTSDPARLGIGHLGDGVTQTVSLR